MIIKLFDGTLVKSTDDKRGIVESALARSKNITINGITITPKAIAYIKPGGYSESDTMQSIVKRLPVVDNRGKASPAKEILRERMQTLKATINEGKL